MKISLIKREKIVNFRSFLIIALFVFISVLCALTTLNIAWLGIALFALALCLCAFLAIVFKFRHKKERYKFFTFVFCAVFMCAAFASFLITESNYSDEIDTQVAVYGMVKSDTTVEGSRNIYLSKVKINGISVGGVIKMSVVDTQGKLESGTIISVQAYVKNVRLVDGFNVDGYAFRNNIRYYAEVDTIDSASLVGKVYPGVMIRLREAIFSRLSVSMSEKDSVIAYGMLTGNSTNISSETLDYFSISGLRHILAVSGLHVTILCGFLMFILRLLRLNRRIIAAVTLAAVVFYVFLADFSPSILRAALMNIVMIYVFLAGKRGDILNSLAFAFCVILAFAPFFLFEAGFILSVSCLLGIALFSLPLKRFFRFIRLPKVVAQGLSISLSVQIGLFPACVFIFGSFQPYSFLVNAAMIPFISAVFVMLLLSLIISFATTLLFPLRLCGYGIGAIDFVAQAVSALPYAKIIVYSTHLVFICYVLYFVMSRFVIKRSRVMISLLCIVECALLVLLQNPASLSSGSIAPIDFSYSTVSVVSIEGSNYVVGDFWSGAAIRNKLMGLKLRSVDGIFLNKLNQDVARQVVIFSKTFSRFEVYFDESSTTEGAVEILKQGRVNSLSGFNGENTQKTELSNGFHSLYENGRFCAYGLNYGGISTIFVPFGKNYTHFNSIGNYNIIRSNYYYDWEDADTIFLVNKSNSTNLLVISCTMYADYAFNFKSGEVYSPSISIVG